MHYAGLGVARSLSAHGIPVIGLSAYRTIYGMFTRQAKTLACPDSRDNPKGLLEFLIRLAAGLDGRPVLIPTLVIIDHYREPLEPHYARWPLPGDPLSMPAWTNGRGGRCAGSGSTVLDVSGSQDVERVTPNLDFPRILKPVAAQQWRKAGDGQLIGVRKACLVSSPEQLRRE
jgi:hypothetical protein